VQFLKLRLNIAHVAYNKIRLQTNNFFHKIGRTEVDRSRPYGITTIDGSRGMHQVRSISTLDDTLCEYRQFSCFCVGCMEKFSHLLCTSRDRVEDWSLTWLA
jgi:hypothetical protein